MAIRTILTILNDPASAKGILDVSVEIARRNSAHLIGLYAEAPEQIYVYAPMEVANPSAIAALQEASQERADQIESSFHGEVDNEGVSYEWRKFRTTGGFTSNGVIDSARSADLVICGQFDERTPKAMRSDIEVLIFECGRPVLMVPYIKKEAVNIDRVLIAWNGSREAARAAFDAMPFLKTASAVEILTVDAKEDSSQSADLAGSELGATLARHGINVTVNNVLSGGNSVGAIIENRAFDFGADMLVMGAYTHSRIRERIFGGATNTLLNSMATLTLMSR